MNIALAALLLVLAVVLPLDVRRAASNAANSAPLAHPTAADEWV